MNTIDELGKIKTFTKILDGSLTEFIDDRITSIAGEYTFGYMPNLKHIELPNISITSGSKYIFSGSNNLEYVDLRLAKSFPESTFENKTKLAYVNVESCTDVSNKMFTNCSALTSISLPSATTVRGSAFSGCSSLTNLYIPNLQYIYGTDVFKDVPVSTLESINIDNLLTVGQFVEFFDKPVWRFKNLTRIESDFIGRVPTKIPKVLDFHKLTKISSGALYDLHTNNTLRAFIIRTPSVCDWKPYGGYTFPIVYNEWRIYVPSNLIDQYKEAVGSSGGWKTHASNIVPIEGSPFEDPDWSEEVLDTL